MKAADLCLAPRPEGAGLDHIAPVAFIIATTGEITLTESSYDIFRYLRGLLAIRAQFFYFEIAERSLTPESLAALNCCLRGEKSPHRRWPWDRLPHSGHDSRYEWKAFVEHLGLEVE
jgi:hypothetical protein